MRRILTQGICAGTSLLCSCFPPVIATSLSEQSTKDAGHCSPAYDTLTERGHSFGPTEDLVPFKFSQFSVNRIAGFRESR